jgi:hypothetical protein
MAPRQKNGRRKKIMWWKESEVRFWGCQRLSIINYSSGFTLQMQSIHRDR